MKTLELNQMEAAQGGGFWSDFLGGISCGVGLIATATSGGLAIGAAVAGCAAFLAS